MDFYSEKGFRYLIELSLELGLSLPRDPLLINYRLRPMLTDDERETMIRYALHNEEKCREILESYRTSSQPK